MAEQRQHDDHEAIDRLLPWFVNNTLDPAERDRVRRHLDDCEACRATVSLLSVVQSSVRHATATPIVPPPRADRLLEAIDGFDSGRRRPLRVTTTTVVAASLAIVSLAVALLMVGRDPAVTPPALYETATSATRQATMDYVLNVQFEAGVLLADQQKVLRDLEAKDISGGETNGMYRVTVSLAAASLAELEQFTTDVEALPEIRSANVVALQFPMQRQQ